MTTRRFRRFAACSTLMLALVGLGGVMPQADALEQGPALKVGPEQSVEQAFPPIVAAFPVPSLPDHKLITPEDCKKTPYCHVIPLEVVPASNLEESDEFFVTVELAWETQKIEEGPEVTVPGEKPEPLYSEQKFNDLDMYVWDDPMPEEGEIEPEELAATDKIPEAARMYRPTKGRYQIVVVNYVGPNTGYKIKATYKTEKIEAPFELLEPSFSPPVTPITGPATPVTVPEDDSYLDELPAAPTKSAASAPPVDSDVTSTPMVSGEPGAALPSLSPVFIEPDEDFADFADSAFDDELAAGPGSGLSAAEEVLRQRQAAAVGPVKPASAGSLVFWLALVPIAILGGAGAALWRRSAGALRMR